MANNSSPVSDVDKVKVRVATRTYLFEGYIHKVKLGRENRRLSDTLNMDRRFMPMIEVKRWLVNEPLAPPTNHALVQVAVEAIEFVEPLDKKAQEPD
ncbi:MAG: hypothetical protein AB7P76_07100 [Candidatus Melainabacteria bacterium]